MRQGVCGAREGETLSCGCRILWLAVVLANVGIGRKVITVLEAAGYMY